MTQTEAQTLAQSVIGARDALSAAAKRSEDSLSPAAHGEMIALARLLHSAKVFPAEFNEEFGPRAMTKAVRLAVAMAQNPALAEQMVASGREVAPRSGDEPAPAAASPERLVAVARAYREKHGGSLAAALRQVAEKQPEVHGTLETPAADTKQPAAPTSPAPKRDFMDMARASAVAKRIPLGAAVRELAKSRPELHAAYAEAARQKAAPLRE